MAINFGPSGINPGNVTKSPSTPSLLAVRVKDIVLSPNHPRFKEVGEWRGLGTIFFDSTTTPGATTSTISTSLAKPYFSNTKFYPLINEIVTIISAPDALRNQNNNERAFESLYYFPSINTWNSQHHNAIPDSTVPNPLSALKSYAEIENGVPNREKPNQIPVILGATFEEKNNIKPLYAYEGDYILEGRWGNTLRLGSTVNQPDYPNNWSDDGNKGDPITILTNGFSPSQNPSWVPNIENINNDNSSIYLTSTQNIPLFVSSYKVDSFGRNDVSPKPPNDYKGNQILINSGRLILNAKKDSILLSSPNIIHFSSGDSLHVDATNKVVMSTSEVFLIDRNADQRAVLGDELVFELNKLIPVLEGLAKACTTATAGPFPVATLISIGPALEASLKDFKKALAGKNPKVLSTKVKLK